MSAPRPRPGILDISPYIGGESHAPGAERLIRLASNEGALGPSPRAVEAYRSLADQIHRYPDGGAHQLRQALAREHNLDPGRIVCGNGSDDVIGLITQAYAGEGDEVLYSAHGFLFYPIAARAAGATPIAVPERNLTADVDGFLARVTSRTRIVFLANPNNPTGSCLSAAEVARLHAALPEHVVLLLDAAYAEFVDDPAYSAGLELVERATNVVVTRTFSKIYALGGLRVGWAYGSAEIADVLNRLRGPFNVNAAAQAAAVAALEDREFFAAARAHNLQWRPWLAAQLGALGLTVHPSAGNFILVSFEGEGAAEGAAVADAARQFLKSRGILVRQMGAYGLPAALRITIGRGDEMAAVVESLQSFLATFSR